MRILFFACMVLLAVPFLSRAAEPEFLEETATVNVEVVRAEFDQTIWATEDRGDGTYALTIRVPNSGTYDARGVDVRMSTALPVRYLSSDVSTDARVEIVDDRPVREVHWIVPLIAVGEAVEVEVLFAYEGEIVGPFPLDVSVTSDVSAPVGVRTDVADSASAEGSADASDAEPAWYQRLARWFLGVLRPLAQWLNDGFDRLFW